MEIAIAHERAEGRNPVDVSKKGVGHDIESSGRLIEVKGVGESWTSYTWQPMYVSQVECLNKNPGSFYLYIVKFDDGASSLYVIPSGSLKKDFKLKPESYALTPISKRKLKGFL